MPQPLYMKFTKASGAGNDFILIDNRDGRLKGIGDRLARALCDRHFGVGADGLLLLERSSRAHFSMAYFNADGSYGGMCGNGGRCIAKYAFLRGIAPQRMTFDALDHVYSAEVAGPIVSLVMKDPQGYSVVPIDVEGAVREVHFINTGSPHACIFVNDVGTTNVIGEGRAIRLHRAFQPDGVNVNFVSVNGHNSLQVRTYERGVEGETLACGTGAVAVASAGILTGTVASPVSIQVKSGETLTVSLEKVQQGLRTAILSGSAELLFEGDLEFDEVRGKIAISGPRT